MEITRNDRLCLSRLARMPCLSRTTHCLLERDPRLHNRAYKFERQGSSWLERWQGEACRFLGKSSAWNDGDCEIEQALLQRLSQRDMPLG